MQIRKLSIALMCAVLMAAFLNGCGSSNKESAISAGSVASIGDTACFQCHAATADPLTGETFIEQYKRSLHAELGCESCHGGGAQHNGIGPFPFTLNSEVSDAKKAERCAQCHDGVTVFKGKVAPLSSSPNFQNGNHANPFSAEEEHRPLCARCHSHEGSILYGKEGFSGDATILNNTAFQPVLARDPETFNAIKCATCHEHGGNLRQTKTRDASGNVVTWDPNSNGVIDQFDLCTGCHTMYTNANSKNNKNYLIGSGNGLSGTSLGYGFFTVTDATGAFKNISTAPYFHNTRWFRTLPSTHVDQAVTGTAATGGTTIEGYVVRKSTKNPCYDCHGHEFKANTRALVDHPERSATNFTDWAQSAHAGRLLKIKVAAATGLSGKAQVDAVMKAGVKDTSTKFSAWGHYDWDKTFNADGTSNRGACQRCHTSTGASNFMKNPAGYDYANNDFTHLEGWKKGTATLGTAGTATTSSGQNELLYCWGCHSNAGAGKLYTPGARTEIYAAATAGDPAVTIAYPDIAGSNVCMTCHVGREVGENIKNDSDADGVRGFINSHYLTAGAQLFAKSGYTFSGMDYTNPSFFKHDVIGTAAAPGTGSNGPCIGCHMTSPSKHKFTNVSSSGGAITAITSSVCVTCHSGSFALTPEKLTTEEEEYQAALAGLSAALAAKNIFFFAGANPYFFTAPFVVAGTNTSYTNWAGPYGFANYKNVMGAAFNLNLLAHDPGGFAHNRFYAKRLIWDSIDFIDDGILNNSVTAELDLRLTGQQLTDAKTYLGATRP